MNTSQKEPPLETGRGIDIIFWQVSGFVIGLLLGPALIAAFSLVGSSELFHPHIYLERETAALILLLTPFLAALGGILGTMWALRDRKK